MGEYISVRGMSQEGVLALPNPVRGYCHTLFLASTVSALHRNAHIWNVSHPILVTYYCRVTVYSPGMEAKKLT